MTVRGWVMYVEYTIENSDELRKFKEVHGDAAPSWILLPPGVSIEAALDVLRTTIS